MSLQVLTEAGWRAVPNDQSSAHRTTQIYVKAMLDATQGMAPRQVDLHRATFCDHNKIVLHVLKMERHQACAIAYCLQENPRAGSVRFMAYATGDSPVNIDAKTASQYCPEDVTARHLEA